MDGLQMDIATLPSAADKLSFAICSNYLTFYLFYITKSCSRFNVISFVQANHILLELLDLSNGSGRLSPAGGKYRSMVRRIPAERLSHFKVYSKFGVHKPQVRGSEDV